MSQVPPFESSGRQERLKHLEFETADGPLGVSRIAAEQRRDAKSLLADDLKIL
jgi:hypothetical protein